MYRNEHSSGVRGIALLLSALVFFACMDTTTKYLTAGFDVPLVMSMRYLVHLALMLLLLAPRHGLGLVRTRRPRLVILRGAALAVVSLFVGLALQRMPVAETTAINFLAPMVVMLLAGPLLGESIGRLGWCAAIGGFAGVLLIARPGHGLDAWGLLFSLCAVGANVVYQMLSRKLAGTERTATLLFYTALLGSIGFAAVLPWHLAHRPPTPLEIGLLASMGAMGGIGHYLYTAAYRYAPASILAPLNYLQLVWAGLLGWLVFDHVPDPLSALGMLVVALSGALVTFRARLTRG